MLAIFFIMVIVFWLKQNCPTQKQNIMTKETKTKKTQRVSEDVPYLEPIPLPQELKKRVLSLINRVSDKKIVEEYVYLQNKLTDPNFHPNDYLKFESPSDFRFEYVLTLCKSVYSLREVNSPLPMDKEIFMTTNQKMMEDALPSDDMDDELDGIENGLGLSEFPDEEFSDISEDMRESGFGEDISEMKIHEAFAYFQENCCAKRKDGICHLRHYLIGIGDISINDKVYSGVHIYLYPDKHVYQVDVPKENIKDPLYLRLHTEKNINHEEFRKMCKKTYLKDFEAVLAQLPN